MIGDTASADASEKSLCDGARALLAALHCARRTEHLGDALSATRLFEGVGFVLGVVARTLDEAVCAPLAASMGVSPRQRQALDVLFARPANDAPPEALLALACDLSAQVDHLAVLLAPREDLAVHGRWCAARLRAAVAHLADVACVARSEASR